MKSGLSSQVAADRRAAHLAKQALVVCLALIMVSELLWRFG